MPTIAAISRERHGAKRFKAGTSYAFTAAQTLAPLVVDELPQAALTLPIAFATQDDHLVPVAVLGFAPGQNLLVSADGRWAHAYIPASFRAHPFVLVPDGDHRVLCIDEDSGLVTEGPEGEPLFDDNGPSKPLAEVLSFLERLSARRKATRQVCAVLQQHGLIEPWPITLTTPAGEQQTRLDGLARINEMALNALPDEAFLEVRQAGGLVMAYCQLLSMPHMHPLGQAASARAQAAAGQSPFNTGGNPAGPMNLLTESSLMDFSRLK